MQRVLLPTALTIALALVLGSSALAVDDASPAPSSSPEPQQADAFVLAPQGASFGGWQELGSTPAYPGDGTEFYLDDLAVVGDRLVAVGRTCPIEGGRCDVYGLYSDDATTWMRTEFPGIKTQVEDIASTPDGLIAVGLHQLDGQRHAAVWLTADGIEWAPAAAPPVPRINRIIASGERTVVGTGQGAWATEDGEEWESLGRAPAGPPLAGPGGFLSAVGGGQGQVVPITLWHSRDGKTWRPVQLPAALRRGQDAFGEIQLFALGDRWVLLPKEKAPRSIFTSTDGRDWRQAPRPPGMMAGSTWWIERVGDRVQSLGDDFKGRTKLWEWDLGRQARDGTAFLGGTDFGRPVPWRDGYVIKGWLRDDGDHVTLWRWGPPLDTAPLTPEE